MLGFAIGCTVLECLIAVADDQLTGRMMPH